MKNMILGFGDAKYNFLKGEQLFDKKPESDYVLNKYQNGR